MNLQAENYLNILIADWINLKTNVSLLHPGEFSEIHRKLNLPLIHKPVTLSSVYGTYNGGPTKSEVGQLDNNLDGNSQTFESFGDNCALDTKWSTFKFSIFADQDVDEVIFQFSKDSVSHVNFYIMFDATAAKESESEIYSQNFTALDIPDSRHSYTLFNIKGALQETVEKQLQTNSSFKVPNDAKPLQNFIIDLHFDDITNERWQFGQQARNVASECLNFKLFQVVAFKNITIEEAEIELRESLFSTDDSGGFPSTNSRRKAFRSNFRVNGLHRLQHSDKIRHQEKISKVIDSTRAPRIEVETTTYVTALGDNLEATTALGDNLEATSALGDNLEATTALGDNLEVTPFPDKYEYYSTYSDESSDYSDESYTSSDYTEYSTDDSTTCQGKHCRKRRQAVALAIGLATAVIGGITSEVEMLHHRKQTENKIAHDELLMAKLSDRKNAELQKSRFKSNVNMQM
ncbi:Oidioi.mRNA.OKI2018_I69.YSR.g17191.t1.cds [Oikopleura dioica]|uniref:Oidioi.mRNA.OKI2018_I69.YSR.g17191.t1.cds n=1 Tax=Oikopleura dioica TaxID=34765 RepID=A0ABN7SNL6_OIKDI|nr:Oidioi.mRNA.OKI2018_I69.YSR.g17191.t1.cds [Oikopleura dioica]